MREMRPAASSVAITVLIATTSLLACVSLPPSASALKGSSCLSGYESRPGLVDEASMAAEAGSPLETEVFRLATGVYHIGRTFYVIRPSSHTSVTAEVLDLTVNEDSTFEIACSWKVIAMNGYTLSMSGDDLNMNMYALDEKGKRYDHSATMGAALDGWFFYTPGGVAYGSYVFPAIDRSSRIIVFHDDDQGEALTMDLSAIVPTTLPE